MTKLTIEMPNSEGLSKAVSEKIIKQSANPEEKANIVVVKKKKKTESAGVANSGLVVTDVRIREIDGLKNVKAFAAITFNGAFVVHDLKIIEGDDGYFVSFPDKKDSAGNFKDICHPIDTATRDMINQKVIAAWTAKHKG